LFGWAKEAVPAKSRAAATINTVVLRSFIIVPVGRREALLLFRPNSHLTGCDMSSPIMR
jgi:hypothetical protein